ncbi:hypothetical protein NDU88_004745 [Pleurodeles waltl]|uniref:Uncharacterized protein n=1 Tax=Pleurodeles waltl TaxID=8319 RepID=A0AAV7L1U4_PLEWA|nr:hypothetical protein NDU88_004745 [Pleurodeles waltl]
MSAAVGTAEEQREPFKEEGKEAGGVGSHWDLYAHNSSVQEEGKRDWPEDYVSGGERKMLKEEAGGTEKLLPDFTYRRNTEEASER